MLNLKRKAIAIAILAIPAALASAQSNSSVFRTGNPDDSGYRGPVALDNAYQDRAAAPLSASSSSTFRVVVNPDDSDYRGPVGGIAAPVAVASQADRSGSVSLGLLGTQAQSRPDSTIKVGSTTGAVYVEHLKTARIENDKGQSFTWQFDSPMSISTFPLKAIAPSGFDAGNTQVTILHPAIHLAP
jgi:hypothetical protein